MRIEAVKELPLMFDSLEPGDTFVVYSSPDIVCMRLRGPGYKFVELDSGFVGDFDMVVGKCRIIPVKAKVVVESNYLFEKV